MMCPICRADEVDLILEVPRAPLQIGVALQTRDAALAAPTGVTRLAACALCGFVFNAGYDRNLVRYTFGYNVVLTHSAVYRDYLDAEARYLVDGCNVRHRRVLDIGCGDGYFLRLLKRLGENEGYGFDPSLAGDSAENGLRFSAVPFRPDLVDVPMDLVVLRSVLELIPDPIGFLRDVRQTLRAGAICYLEVPNATWLLESGMSWNVHYEHCSYFAAETLRRTCEAAGLRLLETTPVYEGGQYLRAIAARAENPPLVAAARRFGDAYHHSVNRWTTELRRVKENDQRILLWGAGGRGASFLAAVDPEGVLIDCAVDVNPARHGTFIPVTGHSILSPDGTRLAAYDVIIVPNSTYLAEITERARACGFEGELWTL